MKKIGIYSGVFDPIHHGHIGFAQKALAELGLEKVYFLVEPSPRNKDQASDIRHRLNMVWLALREHKGLELLQIDHDTFSVAETLPWLEEKFQDAKLHLLMGTDQFKSVHKWAGFDQLKDKVNFVVGQRYGDDSSPIPIEHQPITTGLSDLASSSLRNLPPEQLSTVVPDDVASYISTNQMYSN
ncbi:MAG: nicotinate-nicotinamide nucleotide adenylyltransferase [Candidatus Saccharibacteria bacterium]